MASVSERSARFLDGADSACVVEGREVSGLLSQIGRPDDPAHDLGTARLGQLSGEQDAIRPDRLAHRLGDVLLELTAEDLRRFETGTQHRETHNRLALDLVWH